MNDLTHSNLPTSFELTPLLSKLKNIEKEDARGNNNIIQRVKLIELDPQYHNDPPTTPQQQQSTKNNDKTRLFLAVAFGKRVVLAQLFALELGRVQHDDDISATGEAGLDAEDELEWIDVSNARILPRKGNKSDEIGSPVVIFPPSCAEALPTCFGSQKSDDGNKDDTSFAADITSCALIPPPALGTCSAPNSQNKMITRRTVALMLGTAHDEVLSILVNVSQSTKNDNVHFFLEYDECKIIENGKLQEQVGNMKGSVTSHPCVHQILPQARLYGSENGNENKTNEGIDRSCDTLDGHIQVFHPSLPSKAQEKNLDTEEGNAKYTGIRSIAFCRDNLKRFGFGATMTSESGRQVIMNQDIIWITYGNGAIVKLPSWKPFLSFGAIGRGLVDSASAVDGIQALGNGSTAIPLNSPFRSPLDVPTPQTNHHNHPVSICDDDESIAQGPNADDYWSLLSSAVSSQGNSHRHAEPPVKALVLAGQSMPVSTPPIAFNTSRVKSDPYSLSAHEATSEYGSTMEQNEGLQSGGGHDMDDMSSEDGQFGLATGAVVEGTAAVVKGALGLALGAVRWGFGAKRNVNEEHAHADGELDEFMEVDDVSSNHDMVSPSDQHENTQQANGHNTSLKGGEAKDLFPWPLTTASFPFSDIPRRFETATVDPSGSFVATTDNLGRVMLFDLETNQPIRMFKGMRNVACYFAELPYYDHCNGGTGISTRSYLVIHLQQRGAVEVYRLQQGSKLTAVAVPQQKDCVVVGCHGPPSQGSRVDSFVLEKIDESGEDCHYIIDKLLIDDPDVIANASPKQASSKPTSQSESKMQLNILMQLLSPDTNIKCNAQTVLMTFKSIRALADLGEGLDALSKCNRLESEGVESSRLHSQAVSYCKSRLNDAREMESQEGSGMVRKAAISELYMKLSYHVRLSQAYSALHRYESKLNLNGTVKEDQDTTPSKALSSWGSEALSWISASSGNDALKTRFMPSFTDLHNQGGNKPLGFSKFATSCRPIADKDRVYLTKVKRSRLPILRRVFAPLLQDLFVFKVVNSLFDHLGLANDFHIQQQYFGEWCSTLPYHGITKSYLSGRSCPMIRWLHNLILGAYDVSQRAQEKLEDDDFKKTAMLESLMKFCMSMEDLPRAFLLAVMCMEAVSSASVQLEQKTYGKITQLDSVQPWLNLLRKLRVCLLVSLRLAGDVNPMGGVDPMTVSSVSRPDVFSAYSWIARDELTLSHENQVVIALESACISSSDAFYPSSVHGDDALHKKTVLQSCDVPTQGLSLRKPTGLTNDTYSRPLIFYLKDHARCTTHLAANRGLQLANLWGQTPQQIQLLKQAVSTLQTVVNHFERFSLATLVEIYQSRMRPVCRAMLFGFGEHELSEDIVSPLIGDPAWSHEFITCVKQILSMIFECMSKTPIGKTDNKLESSEMWPPLRECPVLNGIVQKLRHVQLSSVELHHTVMFAFEMTHNIDTLESVVPSFSSLFLTGTLFAEMAPMQKGSTQQMSLLDTAIANHADRTSSPVVDNFNRIKDVELFGRALGLDTKYVRTHYFIEMIWLGKDTSIIELLGASSSSLDKGIFVEKVVQIICGRLNATIMSLKKTRNYRGILSLLDAEASRWVKQEAVKCSPSQQKNFATSSLIATHSMVMRVKSISEDLDASLSDQVNALYLMSGTLLKAVQAQEQESVMSV